MSKKHPYKEFVLPNKLRVLLYEMESVMSVFAVLYIKVGAIYENEKQRGISHFTEHVSFLGTQKYPTPLAISQAAQKFGAKYNGWCDRFKTQYWVNLPYNQIKGGVDFLYQLVFGSLIRERDVQKEKGVIMSEYNDFWHNPDKRFNHETWRKRFKQKEHPYSYDAVGIPKTIKIINKQQIHLWRKKFYNPANMILSIAGNIEESKILKTLNIGFNKRKAEEKAKEPRFDSNDYSDFLVHLQKEARPQIRFFISFPLFGWKEIRRQKRIRLGQLAYIFGGGPASRLIQRLREKERFVYEIGSHVNFHTWMGAFNIGGSVPREKLLPAMNAIREEINKFVDKGVRTKEIDLSKSYLTASTLMKFDNPQSIAYYFGHQVFNEERVWFPEDYIKEIEKITKSDLDMLTKQIFDYSRVNISLMGDVPQKTLKEVEQIFKG